MKTQCCGYLFALGKSPVKWNHGNTVVMCHNCGTVYVPVEKTCQDQDAREVAAAFFKMMDQAKMVLTMLKDPTLLRTMSNDQRCHPNALFEFGDFAVYERFHTK